MLYTSALAFFLGLVFVQSASAQRQIPVNIQSNPAGASVFLDSTSGTALGVTPLANVRVAAGAHTLIFRLANYEEARMAVTVARRRETFRAELRALGSVELSAGNDGARGASVTVDGQAVGGGVLQGVPLRVDNLPPGRHQISATRDGYNPFQQWVDVQGGQVVRATILLERSAPTTGSVLVTADVEGAPIFIDGRPTGMVTTAVIDDVPAGNHSVEIRPLEGTPFTQSIIVTAGQRAEVRARIRAVVTAPVTGTIAGLARGLRALSPRSRRGCRPDEHSRRAAHAHGHTAGPGEHPRQRLGRHGQLRRRRAHGPCRHPERRWRHALGAHHGTGLPGAEPHLLELERRHRLRPRGHARRAAGRPPRLDGE
jgi:hypothetical protein